MYVCKMVYNRCIAVIGAVLICTGLCTVAQSVIYTTIGSTVNLTCNLSVERMYVSWLGPPNSSTYAVGNEVEDVYKYNIRLDGNEHEKKHILQIMKMQERNEGLYKCTAIKGQEYFQLLIQKPPRNISIMESNDDNVVFGVVNREMNLTCDVETGNPPETMRWEYDDEVVDKGRAGPLIYTFTPSSKQHLKNFTCTAHNNVSRTPLTKKVSLYLFSQPTVKVYPSRTINITEDQTLVLECIDTSNDNNDNINWTYTANGHIHTIANKVLKLENMNRTNEGQYSCLISNLAGKADDMVTVKVFYPPTVNITYNEHNLDRILNCIANGNPDDYVFSAWEHTTEYGDHIRFINDSGIGCVKLQRSSGETNRHQDQGVYTCRVSNGIKYHGQTNWCAKYSLKTLGLLYFATSNERIQHGIIGQNTNLTLNVVSYTKLKTVTVSNNQSVTISNGNFQLELSKIEDIMYGKKVNVKGYKLSVPIIIGAQEDFDVYTVSVSNGLEQHNISINIRSASVPMAPTQLKAIPGVHTIKVTWEKGFDGGFVQSFDIEYRKMGSDNWNKEKGFSVNEAIINGLESETYFRVRVYSRNSLGRSNSSGEIDVKTGKQLENSSSNTVIHVTIPLFIIILIVCCTLMYYQYKRGNLIRKDDLSCLQWTYRRNADGGQGVENGIYDMQNDLAPVPGAQSNDPPVYSSIDRKHNLSIGQTVSYSVSKKKKPNPLVAHYRHKGKQQEETETDIEMSTSQAEENSQLNYVDVCFDPKPVGHQFKIRGMDQKSEYVDIDFSKSINILPDNENLDGNDEDFSSVEDVIAMKRDMII